MSSGLVSASGFRSQSKATALNQSNHSAKLASLLGLMLDTQDAYEDEDEDKEDDADADEDDKEEEEE